MFIKHNKQTRERHTNNYVNNISETKADSVVSIDKFEGIGDTSQVGCRLKSDTTFQRATDTASSILRGQKAKVQSGNYSSAVNVYRIYNETMNQLSWLDGHVREGKQLEPALNFCRYVLWSGVIDLCNYHAETDTPLKISGANLLTRAKQLQIDVQDRFRTNNLSPAIQMTELEKLNRKLDLIAGRISQISPLQSDTVIAVSEPPFRVIQGGVS